MQQRDATPPSNPLPESERGTVERTAGPPPAVVLSGVTRRYSGGTLALKQIDLQVSEGEFVSLVGPSGCGKSTLLHLIAGLDQPDDGAITAHGQPVVGPGPDRVAVFQDPSLFPWLTVRENVEFGLKVAGVPRKDREERAMAYLQMVHLARFAGMFPKQLSGGMRQRAAIARALALDPRMLLMDEPFAALDAQTRHVLIGELRRIWEQTRKTIVFVTHNLEEALLLSDMVVVMTARPGTISLTHRIDSYHPRDLADPYLTALHRKVMAHLESEIARVMREEMDVDWEYQVGRVSPGADCYMGDNI
jgi:NitT/TauT family transport system ATP-binding protein